MPPATVAIALVLSYLLGSISFSYVIVRALRGIDIRTVGSGNAGATNVLRAAGKAPALLALILDVGKGLAAVSIARWLGAATPLLAAVGVFAVFGHMYPIFLGFRGGKGVATATGTLASLAPLPLLVALALFVAVVAFTRYVSLGSVVMALSFPFIVALFGWSAWMTDPRWPWLVAGGATIAVLIVWKHRANIGRLLAGTESKLGQKVSAASGTDGQSND